MEMSDLRRDLIQLGEQLAADENAAHDLWTWLPSHKVAQRYHGDYAAEHRPSIGDVLREAAAHLAALQYPDSVKPSERRMFESCPCGEDHLP
jgi:hypothetical protein